ncbi:MULTISPECIES: sulfotransferase family 2 domain-containing protein [unclassified Mameliella]|uniref:sulfotransferase family 2 domain-containing protein n=1 Tax=unclassified Mameliella TaxID=2630630 RepID=UPI00273E97D5|nr:MULTISPECIES: sulfotransferase family 2 domain-containing protein [unclassified Mameliella]
MDRTDPDPKAPVDAALIEATYRFYLGRSPQPETAQALIDRQLPLRRLENNMLNSREYWKKGPVLATHRRGPWDGSILVVEPARILFCPIAKVANTSVKDWALRLSGHRTDKPVHTLLDSGKVRLQARYHSEREFDAIMRDPDWARVALLRDPVDRLISCYWDKFVRNRRVSSVLHHTTPVYRFLLREEEITEEQVEEGITFRQFCHYINLAPREEMDPHWAPQSRYLETCRWDHLFRIEDIDAFERFVLDRCGPDLQGERLGMQNVAPRHAGTVDEMLADVPPAKLDKFRNLPNAVLLTPDIEDFIRDYFALDYVLLDRCAR